MMVNKVHEISALGLSELFKKLGSFDLWVVSTSNRFNTFEKQKFKTTKEFTICHITDEMNAMKQFIILIGDETDTSNKNQAEIQKGSRGKRQKEFLNKQ